LTGAHNHLSCREKRKEEVYVSQIWGKKFQQGGVGGQNQGLPFRMWGKGVKVGRQKSGSKYQGKKGRDFGRQPMIRGRE